ncbi:iron-containing alcohol dehydrogenase [Bacillus cereus]|nr:iron-containing alcohol dehydrogenase [Bacillus cereus]
MISKVIKFGNYKYDYIYGSNILSKLNEVPLIKELEQFLIIADEDVPSDIINQVEMGINKIGKTNLLRFPGGEENKNLDVVHQLANRAVFQGANRRTGVIAIGGGLTGNVAGMVAALMFRGLPLIHIPTTLMSATDSVLSLKQAVNLKGGKNLVGQFYAPSLIFTDFDVFKTLSIRDIQSGLCELIKNLLAIAPEYIETIGDLLKTDNNYSTEEYSQFLEFCILAKTSVMEQDPYEKNEGLALEYGHTIGHALELASQGKYRHGECVAFGMLCEAKISQRIGLLSEKEVYLHRVLFDKIGVAIKPEMSVYDSIIHYLKFDNKKGYRSNDDNYIGMVLLKQLGEVNQENNLQLTLVESEICFDVLKEELSS